MHTQPTVEVGGTRQWGATATLCIVFADGNNSLKQNNSKFQILLLRAAIFQSGGSY
jgi:hypothetical protein